MAMTKPTSDQINFQNSVAVPQGYYYELNCTAGTTGFFTRYPVFTA